MHLTPFRRRVGPLIVAGLCATVVAACGSSKGLNTGTEAASGGGMSAMRSTSGSSMAGMSGENSAHTPAKLMRVDGITPIPTQMLATDDWQNMKIQAMADDRGAVRRLQRHPRAARGRCPST